jgi:predicted ATPase
VHYWYQAGQSTAKRSAHAEAIAHLRQGLVLLQTLPETVQRTQREVDMLSALGASLSATKSPAAPEVGETYTSARQLCQQLHDPQQHFLVLRGLWNYYSVRAEHQTAHALGEQLLTLAQQSQDSTMLLTAHRALGTTLLYLGAAAEAHTHFTQGLALYDPEQHRALTVLYGEDAGVTCRSHDAWTLWLLGYPDQGLAHNDEALTLAQQLAHPYSLISALVNASITHVFRREVSVVQERAEAAIRLAKEQGFPFWTATGSLLRGWVLAQQAKVQEGIEQITQSLTAYRVTGAENFRLYWLAFLADAYGSMGQPEAGLTVLTEALTLVETTGARMYEPELYRLKGALLLQQSSDHLAEAETCFQHAIHIAQSQQAKSWELRSVTSLARLWQQGKRQEAHDLLAPVYNWFTEGFDTADLKDAKTLLEALEEGR